MQLREWSNSNFEYGRKLVNSGLEGARRGEEEFLHGKPLAPILSGSAQQALLPAGITGCVAALAYSSAKGHSVCRTVAWGLFGSVVGFAAGMAWYNRRLAASMANGARKRVEAVRDEHWLQENPIDYA